MIPSVECFAIKPGSDTPIRDVINLFAKRYFSSRYFSRFDTTNNLSKRSRCDIEKGCSHFRVDFRRGRIRTLETGWNFFIPLEKADSRVRGAPIRVRSSLQSNWFSRESIRVSSISLWIAHEEATIQQVSKSGDEV